MERSYRRSLLVVLVLAAVVATAPACGAALGEGAAEQPSMLLVSPSQLAFGPVDMTAGPDSAAESNAALGNVMAVTLSNTGGATIVLGQIRVAGQDTVAQAAIDLNHAWFQAVNAPAPGTELGPTDSRTLYVRFTPDGRANAYTASLLIETLSGHGTIAVPMSGSVLGPPVAEVTPSALDFGNMDLNGQADRAITIVNSGESALTIAALSVDAGSDEPFALQKAPEMPAVLQPNETLEFMVRCAPAIEGKFSGSVSMIGSDGATIATVPLSAMAGIGELAVTPLANATDPMATQVIGEPAVERTYVLSNVGKGELAISAIAIAGADFSISSLAAVLQVGDTADVNIRFDDTTGQPSQARVGTVRIEHDGLGASTFDVSVRVALPAYILDEGFQMNALPADWLINGTDDKTHDWELGNPADYMNAADQSPAIDAPSDRALGTAMTSHYAASPARRSYIDSPVLDLSKASKPALRFEHFVSLEAGIGAHDCATLQISLDGGLSFQPIDPAAMLVGGYNMEASGGIDQAYKDGTRCWSGDLAWQAVLVDLGAAAGYEQVVLRWEFSADAEISGAAGWYIDNVQVGEMVLFP